MIYVVCDCESTPIHIINDWIHKYCFCRVYTYHLCAMYRYWEYHCNVCGKFEFNDESLYANKQFEGKDTGGSATNSYYLPNCIIFILLFVIIS